ncbi:PAS domain-containing protein [Chondromyces apiculatus]|uniref:Putative PAS/PAC sensor protein n=1 Tax=Chondromyces apiculatus DSM 436 TaxID=1192034 RepID=A0A017TIJ8_9BACT|nr:PAS domain-containing protein [Chondromyces apiculatus]EYF08727.1 putative PAS/PAC sensor protein [Chondromyces apiculatus DSM 436]
MEQDSQDQAAEKVAPDIATLGPGWARFFASTDDLFLSIGVDGSIDDLSPSWERTLGFTLPELRALRFDDLLHPADRASTWIEFARLQAGGPPGPFTNRYRRKDSTYARVSWGHSVQVGERSYAVARDVSNGEDAQASLNTAHERLQHLLHSCDVVLYAFSVGEDPVLTFISENVSTMFGYTAEEFLSTPRLWFDNIHPDDQERLPQTPSVLPSSGTVCHEYRRRHKDGTYRWVREETKLARDLAGNPLEAFGSWQDITERKDFERTIQQQANTLLELSTPLIPVTDEILVMPLIGMVDSHRAAQVMTTLLEGLGAHHARWAILDITGVGNIDATVADALVRTARAARLLGVAVALTGIRPDVASLLVTLDIDLADLTTFGTLQAGIVHAMGQAPARPRRRAYQGR